MAKRREREFNVIEDRPIKRTISGYTSILNEFIGQYDIKNTIINFVSNNIFPTVFGITGPLGIGKRTLIKIIARIYTDKDLVFSSRPVKYNVNLKIECTIIYCTPLDFFLNKEHIINLVTYGKNILCVYDSSYATDDQFKEINRNIAVLRFTNYSTQEINEIMKIILAKKHITVIGSYNSLWQNIVNTNIVINNISRLKIALSIFNRRKVNKNHIWVALCKHFNYDSYIKDEGEISAIYKKLVRSIDKYAPYHYQYSKHIGSDNYGDGESVNINLMYI